MPSYTSQWLWDAFFPTLLPTLGIQLFWGDFFFLPLSNVCLLSVPNSIPIFFWGIPSTPVDPVGWDCSSDALVFPKHGAGTGPHWPLRLKLGGVCALL